MVSKIIYNVTLKLESGIEEEWLQWMKESHIPDVLKTGYFSGYKISQLLYQDDSEGKTFAIQYECPSLDDLIKYQNEHAPRLQQEHTARYKDRFVAFRSILKVESES
jgi:hypothetical protein